MYRKKLKKLSLISFLLSLFVLAVSYFFFHFVTDTGIGSFQQEAQKPFVTDMLGQLAVLMIFLSIASLLIAYIVFEEEK